MSETDLIGTNLVEEKTAEKIQNVRLQKQFQYLKSLNRTFEVINRNQVVIQNILENHQHLHIFIPKEYPFKQPLYALSNSLQDKRPVSEVIEQWVPKVKIFQLIELVALRINQQQKIKELVNQHILLKAFHSPKATYLIIVLAIVIRIIVALGPYSGQGDYPNLGDFQAHRNWMSITLNRSITHWYEQTEEQPWWRIDYPPIAAYLSYFFGKIYQTIQSESMLIQPGYQSESLKVYMRFSSLIVDILFLFPPIYLLSFHLQRNIPQLFLLLLLLKPDAILIDHGHFQYNSLILGLILMAFYCLLQGNWYIACILYTLSIHSKQMAVYYSLGFFSALIGLTYHRYRFDQPKIISELIKYAIIVLILSLIIWAPWLGSIQHLSSVVTAIFPVHRGLYQLKVPNFWCISDTFFNWEQNFSKSTLVLFCFLASFVMSLPSMVSLIVNPNRKSLIIGFTTISLTFFMFSYHVHQKSILLPLLLMPLASEVIGGWLTHEFIMAGCFGLFHLLKQDHQSFGYFGICILYILFSTSYTLLVQKIQKPSQELTLEWHRKIYQKTIFRILFLIAAVSMHVIVLMVPPPQKLPYLWNLLFAVFSFAFNCYFLALGNLLQLEWIYNTLQSKAKKHI